MLPTAGACTNKESGQEPREVVHERSDIPSGVPAAHDTLLRDEPCADMPGTVLLRNHWDRCDGPHATYLSVWSEPQLEIGGVFVWHYRWSQGVPERLWSWHDTLHCGEAERVTSFDLDRLLVPSGITGLQDHLVLVYTLDCTYDGSPQRRVLVLLDANGGETLRLRGSTRDPANPWGPHELPKDHRSRSRCLPQREGWRCTRWLYRGPRGAGRPARCVARHPDGALVESLPPSVARYASAGYLARRSRHPWGSLFSSAR